MIRCNSGLGWNLSGGSRERVTPSQMQSVIDVGASFMAGLHCWFSDFMEAAHSLGEHNGTF